MTYLKWFVIPALSFQITSAAVLQLNDENFKAKTDGKTVFLKMFAPWVRENGWGWHICCCTFVSALFHLRFLSPRVASDS